MFSQTQNDLSRFGFSPSHSRLLVDCPSSCPEHYCLIKCQCRPEEECPKDFTAILVAVTVIATVIILLALICYLCKKERKATRQAKLQVFEVPAGFEREIDSSRTNLKQDSHDLPILLNSTARGTVDAPFQASTSNPTIIVGETGPQITGNTIFHSHSHPYINISFQPSHAPTQFPFDIQDRVINHAETYIGGKNIVYNNHKPDIIINNEDNKKDKPTDKSILNDINDLTEGNDCSDVIARKTQENNVFDDIHIEGNQSEQINHRPQIASKSDELDNPIERNARRNRNQPNKDNNNENINKMQDSNNETLERVQSHTSQVNADHEQIDNGDFIFRKTRLSQKKNKIISQCESHLAENSFLENSRKTEIDMSIQDYEHDKSYDIRDKKEESHLSEENDSNIFAQKLQINRPETFNFAEDLDKKENKPTEI